MRRRATRVISVNLMARRDIKGVVDFAYLEGYAAHDPGVIDEVLAIFREQAAIEIGHCGVACPINERESMGYRFGAR